MVRWNSTHEMLARFVRNYDACCSVSEDNQDLARLMTPLTHYERARLVKTIALLEIFKNATETVCADFLKFSRILFYFSSPDMMKACHA
jgi:hypothetical protein